MSEATLTQAALLGGLTARDIVAVLRGWHTDPTFGYGHQWAFFPELAISTGSAERRIDAWAMGLWRSSNYHRISYEIKVSRGDFLHEIKQPAKRRFALLMSNEYYFVTPQGLVKPEELPVEAGLKEVTLDRQLRTVVKAPWRECLPPNLHFMAALCRRIQAAERGGR